MLALAAARLAAERADAAVVGSALVKAAAEGQLVPLVRELTARPPADDACLRGPFPEADQLAFGRRDSGAGILDLQQQHLAERVREVLRQRAVAVDDEHQAAVLGREGHGLGQLEALRARDQGHLAHVLGTQPLRQDEIDLGALSRSSEAAPVVKLANVLLIDSLKRGDQ